MVAKMYDTCTIPGCGNEHVARGYCDNHYRRFRRNGDPLVDAKPVRPPVCSVDGCERRHAGYGLCKQHLKRFHKHGDPLGGRKSNGASLAFLQALVGHEGDECIPWPFTRYTNGYGSVWHEGMLTGAHRLMCRLAHGEPSSEGLEAAHGCGFCLCVNPRHLRWATPAENAADKIIHGTNGPHTKKARELQTEGAS